MTTNDTQDRDGIIGGALTVALLITLAVQNAVPPMATDMYSAAFPQITADLATNSTMLGFTLTTFFVGYATGQVLGGAISDQIGRRRPIIAGGIIALIGSIICVLTPNIWVLLVGRVFQGLGGGVASSVARAILVDVAHGKTLARAMSLIQAIVGFAPMLAPVLGAFIITHATWRVVFWALAAFTLLMAALAWSSYPSPCPRIAATPAVFRGSSTASSRSCASVPSWVSCSPTPFRASACSDTSRMPPTCCRGRWACPPWLSRGCLHLTRCCRRASRWSTCV